MTEPQDPGPDTELDRHREAGRANTPDPDASDVVEGQIGDAELRDPATAPDAGADLEALPEVDDVSPEDPASTRAAGGERSDGRPTGDDDDRLKAGKDQRTAPTVAPEERGHEPSTEHGPGADL